MARKIPQRKPQETPIVNPMSEREALGADWDQPDMRTARYMIRDAIPKIQKRKAQNEKLRSTK